MINIAMKDVTEEQMEKYKINSEKEGTIYEYNKEKRNKQY